MSQKKGGARLAFLFCGFLRALLNMNSLEMYFLILSSSGIYAPVAAL
jgi:hypothetical protein